MFKPFETQPIRLAVWVHWNEYAYKWSVSGWEFEYEYTSFSWVQNFELALKHNFQNLWVWVHVQSIFSWVWVLAIVQNCEYEYILQLCNQAILYSVVALSKSMKFPNSTRQVKIQKNRITPIFNVTFLNGFAGDRKMFPFSSLFWWNISAWLPEGFTPTAFRPFRLLTPISASVIHQWGTEGGIK